MPAKHFCFKVRSPFLCMGAGLGEEGLSGECSPAIICQRVISAIFLVLLSQGMFRNIKDVQIFGGCSEGARGGTRGHGGEIFGLALKYFPGILVE